MLRDDGKVLRLDALAGDVLLGTGLAEQMPAAPGHDCLVPALDVTLCASQHAEDGGDLPADRRLFCNEYAHYSGPLGDQHAAIVLEFARNRPREPLPAIGDAALREHRARRALEPFAGRFPERVRGQDLIDQPVVAL